MPETSNTQTRRPLTKADRVAAALQGYADAIRLGQTPVPNYINLHAAALPFKDFMRMADHLAAHIEVEGDSEDGYRYALITLPFGAGILPDSISAKVHATSSQLDKAALDDIDTHNTECLTAESAV